jgi:hypothetical protein
MVIFDISFHFNKLDSTIFRLKLTFELSQAFTNTFLVKFSKVHRLELIETLKLSSFQVLLYITGDNVIKSHAQINLGRLSSIINSFEVIIVSYATHILLSSEVLTSASITQVVRLSGRASKVIVVFHELSVVKSQTQKAVSLKFHLDFLLSHHFTHSPLHHFSHELTSFTSNLSTKYFKLE